MTRKGSISFGKWSISVSPVFVWTEKDPKLLGMTLGNRRCIQHARHYQVLSGCLSGLFQELVTLKMCYTLTFAHLCKRLSHLNFHRLKSQEGCAWINTASSSHCQTSSAWCWPGVSSMSPETSSFRISRAAAHCLACSTQEEEAGCCRPTPRKPPAWS